MSNAFGFHNVSVRKDFASGEREVGLVGGGAALPHSPWQSRSLTSDIAVQRKETCLFLLGSQKERLDLVGRWGLEEEMVPPVSLTCSLAQWGLYPFSC